MSRATRFSLFVLALIASAACGGGDKATGPASIAGLYTLRTVNGSPLPLVIPYGTGQVSLTAGSVTLLDTTYRGTLTVTVPVGNGINLPQTFPDSGGYTHTSAGAVTLTSAEGSTAGTLHGDTLTFSRSLITLGTFTLAFVRQR